MADVPVAGGLTTETAGPENPSGSGSLSETENPNVAGLAGYLRNVWQTNYDHKISSGLQGQILMNLRARDNTYESEKLAALNADGLPTIYIGLTGVKCGHAESWLSDIFSSTDKTWGLRPTPKPELDPVAQKRVQDLILKSFQETFDPANPPTPEELMQLARDFKPKAEKILMDTAMEAAKKMEIKIEDQLVEGGWQEAFDEFISDLVTCKLGILKGPIVRKVKTIEYFEEEEGGPIVSREVYKTKLMFSSVSPLDFFPSPRSGDVQKGNLCERIHLERSELISLKGEEGYDDAVIDEILQEGQSAPRVEDPYNEQDRADLELKENPDDEATESISGLDGIEFFVSVQGQLLRDYGFEETPTGETIEDLVEYNINAIFVADRLIYVRVYTEPLAERPYSVCGWKPIPGSLWFKGVPETMESLQSVCNASVRSLVYNMSIASGPQTEVDISRLAPGEDVETGRAGKVWQTVSKAGGSNVPAIRYFQAGSNAAELMAVYDRFAQMADDYTGIPAYAFGNDRVAGAGRTSSGLSMLMGASAKGIKKVVLNIDRRVFKTMIKRVFRWNMKYNPDPDVRGDMDVVSTGAVGIMVREQLSDKRMNFLQTTNNPIDLKLMGLEGRANVLRETTASIEMAPTRVVRSDKELKELEKQEQANMAQQAQLAGQAQQVELGKVQADTQQALAKAKSLLADLELRQQELQLTAASTAQDGRAKDAAAQAKLLTAQIQSAQAGLDALERATALERGTDDTNKGTGAGTSGSGTGTARKGSNGISEGKSAGRTGPE